MIHLSQSRFLNQKRACFDDEIPLRRSKAPHFRRWKSIPACYVSQIVAYLEHIHIAAESQSWTGPYFLFFWAVSVWLANFLFPHCNWLFSTKKKRKKLFAGVVVDDCLGRDAMWWKQQQQNTDKKRNKQTSTANEYFTHSQDCQVEKRRTNGMRWIDILQEKYGN